MGRVLALDVGERRVGIALSDPSRTIARPLQTISQHPRPAHFAAVQALIDEHDVDLIVVGRPISLDGTEGPQARRIARYQDALGERVRVPVVPWDERYSTRDAHDIRHASGSRQGSSVRRGRSGPPGVDAVAACVILQSFLDSHRPARSLDDGFCSPRGSDVR